MEHPADSFNLFGSKFSYFYFLFFTSFKALFWWIASHFFVLACGTLLLLLRRMFWLFESLKENFLFEYRSDAHLFISKRELRSCLVVDRSRRRTRKHSATSPTLPCAASPPGSHVFFEPSDGRNKNKKRLKGMMVEESYGGGGYRG